MTSLKPRTAAGHGLSMRSSRSRQNVGKNSYYGKLPGQCLKRQAKKYSADIWPEGPTGETAGALETSGKPDVPNDSNNMVITWQWIYWGHGLELN